MNQFKSFDEARQVSNIVYAAIEPVLNKYETRGHNSHTRAQILVKELVDKMSEWISMNKQVEEIK